MIRHIFDFYLDNRNEIIKYLYCCIKFFKIDMLDLKRPIYKKTAAYGHFGREEDGFTWEQTDKADALKASL